MGPGGFVLYCLWSLGVFLLLGAAWFAAAPEEGGRSLPGSAWPLFAWARMVREAVSDLLPFSQLGGIVVSVRVLTTAALPPRRVHASLVVDMTTEMASQLTYTLFGLALMGSLLIGDGAAAQLRPAILGGTFVMVAIILLFFAMQGTALDFASRLAARLVPGSVTMADLRQELAHIYARRDRVALAFAANLAAWVASGIGAWLALRWMGAGASIWDILALESLIFTLRSVAFAIPGALGVQEAAYAVAGPLFGLPPETALALSLAKRARDLTIGLPTLLAWQANEVRSVTLGSGK